MGAVRPPDGFSAAFDAKVRQLCADVRNVRLAPLYRRESARVLGELTGRWLALAAREGNMQAQIILGENYD